MSELVSVLIVSVILAVVAAFLLGVIVISWRKATDWNTQRRATTTAICALGLVWLLYCLYLICTQKVIPLVLNS